MRRLSLGDERKKRLECGPMINVMVTLPKLVAPSVQRRKVWLTPTTRVPCSNAAKTRNPLKFGGCPKLTKGSQPLVGRCSPYYEDMWRRYCCLTSFFPIVDTCLCCEPDKVVRWCPDGKFLAIFCVLYFSEPRAAHFRPAF